jgi:hypothetical protein
MTCRRTYVFPVLSILPHGPTQCWNILQHLMPSIRLFGACRFTTTCRSPAQTAIARRVIRPGVPTPIGALSY